MILCTATQRVASLDRHGFLVPCDNLLSVPALRPDTSCAIRLRASEEARSEGPHLTFGLAYRRPGGGHGPSHPHVRCSFSSWVLPCYDARSVPCFSTAPAGGVPVSTYFHSSTRSFLASATIPILRSRELPCPKRRWYHRLSSLSG